MRERRIVFDDKDAGATDQSREAYRNISIPKLGRNAFVTISHRGRGRQRASDRRR
jgi:hypothetical protein